jgi:Holliday junction DNA helicase RuvA
VLDSIEGRVVRIDEDGVILVCGAFGLAVRVPAPHGAGFEIGNTCHLAAHLVVREDEFVLYGFRQARERDFFRLLLGVSGLGPEKARGLLAALPVTTLATAIHAEDSKPLRAVRGIGQKLAERIVLELKGAVEEFASGDAAPRPARRESQAADVVATLLRLGYPKTTAEAAAEAALAAAVTDAPLEELVKQALRALQRPVPEAPSA